MGVGRGEGGRLREVVGVRRRIVGGGEGKGKGLGKGTGKIRGRGKGREGDGRVRSRVGIWGRRRGRERKA